MSSTPVATWSLPQAAFASVYLFTSGRVIDLQCHVNDKPLGLWGTRVQNVLSSHFQALHNFSICPKLPISNPSPTSSLILLLPSCCQPGTHLKPFWNPPVGCPSSVFLFKLIQSLCFSHYFPSTGLCALDCKLLQSNNCV